MNRRMYSRNGWVDVDDSAARETCQRLPHQWTLEPWKPPAGAQHVNVPDHWADIQADRRIGLARQIKGDLCVPDATDPTIAEADALIGRYLAGMRHPSMEPAR